MLKRPMLAAATNDHDLQNLSYPLLASYKMDGVRAIHVDGLRSRSYKAFPNAHVNMLFDKSHFAGLDGELVVGNPFDKNLMQQTTSGVMSRDGEPDVKWYIFDKWDEDGEYVRRAKVARAVCENDDRLVWVPQIVVRSWQDVLTVEEKALSEGYEGLILRDPRSPYKEGRSTVKQGWMLKVKRFEDSEAEVLDTYEEMQNDNEATTDARGYTKRSSHAANKIAKNTLGGLLVRDVQTGVEFQIGAGFTAEQRRNLWEGRKYLLGKLIKYKYFPVGVKDKPRHPVFLGFRDRRDL